MKKNIALLLLATPMTALIACGAQNQDKRKLSEQETALLSAASSTDEAEELIADQVEELSGLLALEDESSEGSSASLSLAREKESSLEKSCKLQDGKLILNRDKSKAKELDKNTRRGRVEIALARESSFERTYSPAEGKELAVACKTEKGSIKFLSEKIADLSDSSMEAKHSRKWERSLKLDGVDQKSRKSESTGSRLVKFLSASEQEGQLIINKQVSFSSKSTVTKVEKGESSTTSNERMTIKEAPLKVEVIRDAASGKLIHKLIESGHVQISRGESRKIDVVYEKVKFSAECKPVSGRLLVTQTKQEGEESSAKVLAIRFADGEALVSRDGGAEKKMESLNLRLETCRK